MLGEWSCKWREERRDKGFDVKTGLPEHEELKQTGDLTPSNNWVQIMVVEGDMDASGEGTCMQVEGRDV